MSGGNLFVLPWVSPLDNRAVVPNSKLTFSLTGTSTLSDTYTNSALTTANSNPIQADAEGTFTPIYLDPTITYRVKWTTQADVQIKQSDDIVGGQTVSSSYRLQAPAPSLIFQETDATPTNTRWRIAVNGEFLTVDLGNDAESIWTTVLQLGRNGTLKLTDPAGIFGSQQVITGQTGVFTGTLLGMTATTIGTVSYIRSGSYVTLYLTAPISGTSNSTQMVLTGVPSALQPTTAKSCVCTVRDNTVPESAGLASILNGTISFYLLAGTAYSITGFTASGTKGLDAEWTISYPLDVHPA